MSQKAINITLWVVQLLLAVFFIWLGFTKTLQPEKFPFPWIKDNPVLALLTGILDMLTGFRIVLPVLLDIKPGLTLFTAIGIVCLMVVASIFHIARNEASAIGFNLLGSGLKCMMVYKA